MNAIPNKMYKRVGLALTAVNGLLLLAACRYVHQLGLCQSESLGLLPGQGGTIGQELLSLPSVLMVILMMTLLVILIGKEWLRPAWLPLVLNILWLVSGSFLLHGLATIQI